MAIELGSAYISILPSTSKLAPGIRRELDKAERHAEVSGERAGRRFGGRFKSTFAGLAKGGLLAGIAGASLLGGAGLKTAAELEQSKIGFETMLGSAKAADKFLNQIKTTAAQTPFELKGLTSASQKLLAFGFDVKEVIPTLTTLGDAASGLGLGQEGMDRIIMAVGQIQAKGKVQGDELLQLTEAGIPAQKILQNQLGLTADAYADLQKAGKISADDAIPALLAGIKEGTSGLAGDTAKFGGLMGKQAQSLSGLFSTLKDTALVGVAEAIEPLMPMLKTGLTGAINTVAPAMSGLASGIKTVQGLFQGGGGAMSAWGSTLSSLWTSVSGFVQELMPTIQRVAGQIMGALGPGLASLGETVKRDLVPAFQRILPVVAPVAKFLISVLGGAVVGVIKGVVQALKGVVAVVSGVFNLVASLVKGDWAGAWDAVKQIFKGAIDFVIGAFKVWWNLGILAIFKRGALALLGGWRGLMNGLKAAPGKAFALINKAFMGGLKLVGRGISGAVKGYIGLWRSLFSFLGRTARDGWKALRSAFGGALAAVRTVISRAITGYVNMWRGLYTRLVGAGKAGWNLVRAGAVKAIGGIKKAFSNGVEGIRKIWDGIKKAASAPVRFVIDTVYNDGLRKLIGLIPGVDTPKRLDVAGFSEGGYTGRGGKYEPAGVVHRDEYVISKSARRTFERENPGTLDYLNRTGRLPGYAKGGRVWPVPGRSTGTYAGHDGVDINRGSGWDDYGDPIWNAAAGRVSYVGTGRGYGLATFVRGAFGELVYGHMSSALAKAGQAVNPGDLLGRVGNTGNSSAPHLHFGFPGGTTAQALAFLNGASVTGGKGGGGMFDTIRNVLSTAKKVWSGVTGMAGGGWSGLVKGGMKDVLGDAKGWINGKVPGPGPLPGGVFDNGGVLEPGAAAINLSKKPEAIFNHRQFKAFAEGVGGGGSARRAEMVITNWKTGEGYFREIADDAVADNDEFAGTIRRMR